MLRTRTAVVAVAAALIGLPALAEAQNGIALLPRDGGRTQIAGLTFESFLSQLEVRVEGEVMGPTSCHMLIFDSEGESYGHFIGEEFGQPGQPVFIRDPGEAVFSCRPPGEFIPGDMFRPRDQLLPPRMVLNADFMLSEREWDTFALADELRMATPQFDRFLDQVGDPGVDAEWIALMIVMIPGESRMAKDTPVFDDEPKPITFLLSGEGREFRRR